MGLFKELRAAGITTIAQLKAALASSSSGSSWVNGFGLTGQITPGLGYSVALVKILTAASGGGKYNGVLLRTTNTPAPATGTLAETDFGTIDTTANCLVLNSAEVGKSTHDLTTGTPVSKIFVGVLLPHRSTTGLYVVGLNGIDWENCT